MDKSMKGQIKHIPHDADERGDPAVFHEHCWKTAALELLLRHEMVEQGSTLLDYGCGRGEFIGMAREAGFAVRGLDVDPVCVERSRQYGEAALIENVEDGLGGWPDASVDVVSSFHVLEHVENPRKLLNSMRRVARRKVLVAVPNMEAFRSFRGRMEDVNEGHLQGWDRETLINLAERHCGLRLVGLAYDLVRIPILHKLFSLTVGMGFSNWFSQKVLSRLFPHRSISIIALFSVDAKERR